MFSDAQLEKLAINIFKGKLNRRNLPKSYFKDVLKYLIMGVDEGASAFETKTNGIFKPNPELKAKLLENLTYFSAHKTYQQVRDVAKQILLPSGTPKSLDKFLADAMPIVQGYSQNWLTAEYSATVGQAQSAFNWQQSWEDRDVLPLRQYVTVGDSNVRPAHARFNGIILPITDSWWKTNEPLNDWGCRCDAKSLSDGVVSDISNIQPFTEKEQPPLFRHNAGIEQVIFDKTHPYYAVPKIDAEFAKAGFGLFDPKKI